MIVDFPTALLGAQVFLEKISFYLKILYSTTHVKFLFKYSHAKTQNWISHMPFLGSY